MYFPIEVLPLAIPPVIPIRRWEPFQRFRALAFETLRK
ncbi:hypothetical protein EV11_0764 [Prochlorococcus sp. SS52]|nr:hypothetical protein EV04_0928 [Prochlorococcus marinus str. LG]KGG22351.1 hypothetical protein EV08_0169 [Prochlorococcus marinus str. SS2]KGG22686.1 hypothetical protein EV09_1425 [Prochlorococcus marinus str. SS35]KGG32892.1 hypothetical protein EV10_0872 [Prochlorococcus marinus str. SS51]KGG36587.1 hypothetical protein EV11_0764 [Prochlorococcus sp. SS52]